MYHQGSMLVPSFIHLAVKVRAEPQEGDAINADPHPAISSHLDPEVSLDSSVATDAYQLDVFNADIALLVKLWDCLH